MKKYSRVVLKLSGEAFGDLGKGGIHMPAIKHMAGEIAEASRVCQVAVVVGGGNIVRGGEISRDGVGKETGDYMGMLATVINALALQDVLEHMGAQTRVLTALQIHAVAEPFIRRRAMRHLEKGRIVILAAGTGNPNFTTDTAAALRAAEIKGEALLKATKVDGIYDADPKQEKGAKLFSEISYLDVINKRLKIMDVTAISMCMSHSIPIVVFNFWKAGNVLRVINGEKVGTTVGESSTTLA